MYASAQSASQFICNLPIFFSKYEGGPAKNIAAVKWCLPHSTLRVTFWCISTARIFSSGSQNCSQSNRIIFSHHCTPQLPEVSTFCTSIQFKSCAEQEYSLMMLMFKCPNSNNPRAGCMRRDLACGRTVTGLSSVVSEIKCRGRGPAHARAPGSALMGLSRGCLISECAVRGASGPPAPACRKAS